MSHKWTQTEDNDGSIQPMSEKYQQTVGKETESEM